MTTTIETPAAVETKTELKWERETCSRCAGSGNYSYCQQYGTTCFKCGGRGVTLTKRGAAASAWFRKMATRPASTLKIGDWIEVGGCTMGGTPYTRKAKIVSIRMGTPDDYSSKWLNPATGEWEFSLEIRTAKEGLNTSLTSSVRVYLPKDQTTALLKLSIQYQNSLTKAGTVRK